MKKKKLKAKLKKTREELARVEARVSELESKAARAAKAEGTGKLPIAPKPSKPVVQKPVLSKNSTIKSETVKDSLTNRPTRDSKPVISNSVPKGKPTTKPRQVVAEKVTEQEDLSPAVPDVRYSVLALPEQAGNDVSDGTETSNADTESRSSAAAAGDGTVSGSE